MSLHAEWREVGERKAERQAFPRMPVYGVSMPI